MKYLIALFFFNLLLSQNVEITKLAFYSGDEFGFYNEVEAVYLNDSEMAIFDKGNTEILIMNAQSKKIISRFGKRGNGPEEFQGYSKLNTMNNKIYMYKSNIYSVFSKAGQFLFDKKIDGSGYKAFFDSKKQVIRIINYSESKQINLLSLSPDLKTSSEDQFDKENIFGKNYDDNTIADFGKMFSQPHAYNPVADGIIGFYKGSFKVFKLSYEDYIIKNYEAIVNRQKYPKDYVLPINGPMNNPGFRALLKKTTDYVISASNGYQDDIIDVLGQFKNYGLFQIISQKESHSSFCLFNFTDPTKPLFFDIKDLDYKDFKLTGARLDGNKLFLFSTDYSNGASFAVYKLDIK